MEDTLEMAELASGDANYIADVGPPSALDFIGATRFRLLFTLGLRPHHRLLDVGCGSLESGRLLIASLYPGHYFGVEPNRSLVEDGIRNLGEDLVRSKDPSFDYSDRFEGDAFGVEFDFVVAGSVFTHAGPELIERSLQSFSRTMRPDGIITAVFIEGEEDHAGPSWVYPETVRYRRETIAEFARAAGLALTRLGWFHPREAWYLLAKDRKQLPSKQSKQFLREAVLDELRALGPIVIGGIGGSGTRAVARIARVAGAYTGSNLNSSEDQLDLAGFHRRWITHWLARPEACETPMRNELAALHQRHLRGIGAPGPWGWKLPDSIFLLPFLHRALPGLRFLHLVRDGRDMAFSRNQYHLRHLGDALLGDAGAVEPRRSIAFWAKINDAVATYGEEQLGERYLRVRYEDLCREPRAVVPRLLAFGGLEGDLQSCLDEVKPPGSLGRWRSSEQGTITELERIAGPTLRRFGYLDPSRQ